MFHFQPSRPFPTFLIYLLLAEFIVMNLRYYDNLKEIGILHTLFHLSLEILFPFNTYFFLLVCGFASQCVSSEKKNHLPSFTQRDLKMRSLLSVAYSLLALLASRESVQLIPTPLHELLLPDLQLC